MIPTTIHFDKNFSRKLRLSLVKDYIFNKERLSYIVPKQLEVCSEEELIYKYKSIFPTQIDTLDDILKLAKLDKENLEIQKREGDHCEKLAINFLKKIMSRHPLSLL